VEIDLNLIQHQFRRLLPGNNRNVYKYLLQEYNLTPFDLETNASMMTIALQFVNKPKEIDSIFNEVNMEAMNLENCAFCENRLYIKGLADIELEKYDEAIGLLTPFAKQSDYISLKKVLLKAHIKSGNNAVVGPNLVPLVTLGIPGNLAAALILGGFMIKGLTPGPMFMQENAPLLYGLFAVLLISNLYTFLVGNFFVRYVRKITRIPKPILFTAILIFSVIGSYVFQSSIFDIFMMFAFGILGYLLTKLEINLPTVIVAFFLGPLFERKIRQALLISGGDATIFFTRPICLTFFILTILGVVFLIRRKRRLK